jgi:hypothetical protein
MVKNFGCGVGAVWVRYGYAMGAVENPLQRLPKIFWFFCQGFLTAFIVGRVHKTDTN